MARTVERTPASQIATLQVLPDFGSGWWINLIYKGGCAVQPKPVDVHGVVGVANNDVLNRRPAATHPSQGNAVNDAADIEGISQPRGAANIDGSGGHLPALGPSPLNASRG